VLGTLIGPQLPLPACHLLRLAQPAPLVDRDNQVELFHPLQIIWFVRLVPGCASLLKCPQKAQPTARWEESFRQAAGILRLRWIRPQLTAQSYDKLAAGHVYSLHLLIPGIEQIGNVKPSGKPREATL
jgi:hypothetical protein